LKKYNYMRTSFNEYLKRKEFTTNSIASIEKSVNRFLKWVEKENLQPAQVRYADLLLWMKHKQKSGTSQRTIQLYLWCIKHYYDYLIEQKETQHNPTTGIKVQGIKRKTLYHIFKPHELHSLYNAHPEKTLADKRDKVMLGLFVYQGLQAEELGRLEVTDVKLKAGQIEILGSRRSNGRVLNLEPPQYMSLHEYITDTRNRILASSKEQTTKLIVGQRSSTRISNLIQELLRKIRMRNKQVKNVQQLRASVIVKWLKQHNLRQVQYLAGHRYISSTEDYQQNEMEGLTEEVNTYHPLG
jgi:site-specific recombinase XerD